MRKRRAILFDDDSPVLSMLTDFFEDLGYEVIACREPVLCPVYGDPFRCAKNRPCGDLLITELDMPRMNGLELLKTQSERGCNLSIKNKAILSGRLDGACRAAARSLGCAAFAKPFHFTTLKDWVQECESRMDLSRPLGARRKEQRKACSSEAVFSVGRDAEECPAEVVNQSDSGLCVRVGRPLAPDQVVQLRTPVAPSSDRLVVRWTRPDPGGGWCAGLSCCLQHTAASQLSPEAFR